MARRGLAALSKLHDKSRNEDLEMELKVILGISLFLAGSWESAEAEQALEEACVLGRTLRDDRNVLAAEWGRIVAHCVHGRYHAARALGEEMIALAAQTGDPGHLVVAHSTLGIALGQLGELKGAAEHLSFALSKHDPDHLVSHPALGAVDFGVRCHCYLARCLWLLGFPDQARHQIQQALNATRNAPAGNHMFLARLTACTVHQFLRESQTCHEIAESVIRLSTGLERELHAEGVGWAGVSLGWSLVQEGRVDEGLPMMREILMAYRRQGRGWIGQSVMFAETLCNVGEYHEAVQVLSEIQTLVEETGEAFFQAEIHRVRGDVLAGMWSQQRGTGEDCNRAVREIESYYESAIAVAQQQQAKSLELRAARSLALLLDQQGRRDEGRRRLAAVYEWFTEGFETNDLKDAKALLDSWT